MVKKATDHSLPGRLYNMTEREKAEELGMSTSWLQKDRMKVKPEVDFKRFGGAIRYATDRC
ncbi:hypothetical protein [Falsiruegeria mediterranea]